MFIHFTRNIDNHCPTKLCQYSGPKGVKGLTVATRMSHICMLHILTLPGKFGSGSIPYTNLWGTGDPQMGPWSHQKSAFLQG